jgi:uncharacterized phage-associated protein
VANVHDVAAYILKLRSPMTAMKLQKLVYYCQAWSLVWDDAPIFAERIEAWANGPVVRELYERHRGMFVVKQLSWGNPDALTPAERDTVDAVMQFYGDKPSQWLSDLTHQEPPWRDARKGYAPGTNCDREITQASMAEFYSSLAAARQYRQ